MTKVGTAIKTVAPKTSAKLLTSAANRKGAELILKNLAKQGGPKALQSSAQQAAKTTINDLLKAGKPLSVAQREGLDAGMNILKNGVITKGSNNLLKIVGAVAAGGAAVYFLPKLLGGGATEIADPQTCTS